MTCWLVDLFAFLRSLIDTCWLVNEELLSMHMNHLVNTKVYDGIVLDNHSIEPAVSYTFWRDFCERMWSRQC